MWVLVPHNVSSVLYAALTMRSYDFCRIVLLGSNRHCSVFYVIHIIHLFTSISLRWSISTSACGVSDAAYAFVLTLCRHPLANALCLIAYVAPQVCTVHPWLPFNVLGPDASVCMDQDNNRSALHVLLKIKEWHIFPQLCFELDVVVGGNIVFATTSRFTR